MPLLDLVSLSLPLDHSNMSRKGSTIVTHGTQLGKGLLVRRPSNEGIRLPFLEQRSWQSSSGIRDGRGEEEHDKPGSRQMHYNTQDTRRKASVSATRNVELQEDRELKADQSIDSIEAQEAVRESRAAGGGLTWAEMLLTRRKRWLGRP